MGEPGKIGRAGVFTLEIDERLAKFMKKKCSRWTGDSRDQRIALTGAMADVIMA